MSNLRNKVAIVTGASKGVGADVALALAGKGAGVIVNYESSRIGAEKVVGRILAGCLDQGRSDSSRRRRRLMVAKVSYCTMPAPSRDDPFLSRFE